MLKHRVAPLILLTGYNVVKSIQFSAFRTIGNPISVCRVYESRGVDELILLDIRASMEGRGPNLDIVRDIAGECFMPLTIGGGITSVEDARNVLRAGADKVAINSHALKNPRLISEIAGEFGSQCCVVSIDAKKNGSKYEIYVSGGKKSTGIEVSKWVQVAESLGAGEILINSIDSDGCMSGYDIGLIKAVSDFVKIPVIAAGGAGTPADLVVAVIEGGASAVAAGSMYHFTNTTPIEAKIAMDKAGIPVRLK